MDPQAAAAADAPRGAGAGAQGGRAGGAGRGGGRGGGPLGPLVAPGRYIVTVKVPGIGRDLRGEITVSSDPISSVRR
jgi:hypothetical protein